MEQKNQTWLIVGIIGCLGCGGIVVLGLVIFGFGFFMPTGPAAYAPPTPPSMPTPVPVPPAAPAAPAPAGWVSYQHAVACVGNPNLQLPSFSTHYPQGFTVLPCNEMQPQPWGYVTFHAESPQGARQVTMGFANGPVTLGLLHAAADDLTRQLNAGATRTIDESPLTARGASLVRRDSAFDVAAPIGPFVPGTYIYRQVVVPNPGQHHGLQVTLIQPAPQGEAAALTASQNDLLQIVDSIRY